MCDKYPSLVEAIIMSTRPQTRPIRLKRTQSSAACFYCRQSHTACNDQKPCNRCIHKRLVCCMKEVKCNPKRDVGKAEHKPVGVVEKIERKPICKMEKKQCCTTVTLQSGQVISLIDIEMFYKDCTSAVY